MTAPNLTRDQARERAALLDVHAYHVELDLTDGEGRPSGSTFASRSTVSFTATPGASTFVDVVAPTVHRVVLNGVELDVSGYDEEQGIALPDLAAENELLVEAECDYSHTGEGLHRFVDPTDDAVYLYSQFETADAKRMFACFDQPDLKATFDVTVVAPRDWTVISNAAVERTQDQDSATRHVFTTTPVMSTYLVALVAGPYASWTDTYSDSHGEIPLGLYCRASLAEFMDPERLFTETKQGFDFYHRNFGVPYAFGKYDQSFVPEFNAGAMENAGCVTFLEDYVFRSKVTRAQYERRAETVLHEMAHMWFGDLVTMRWWDDLWLNESFATFASVLCQSEATEYTSAWTTFATVEKSWAYRQDQLPSTHPVAADIPDLQAVEVNFDGITYAKGASVLKQLVAYVGLEAFLEGLRSYFRDHAYDNADFSDLLGALEKASGRELSGWGDQWLRTTGLNRLAPEIELADDGTYASVTVVQDGAAPGDGELRTHRLAVGVYADDGSGALVRTHRAELDVTGERTVVDELAGMPAGDLVLVNDEDLTYCSMRLDDRSLATVVDRIADITDPLARTLCWSAAWEMTRDGQMRARDFLGLVQGGIGAETEIAVVSRLLLQAQTAVASYADPAWAEEHGRPALADRLLELARSADGGSDFQLAFVSSLAGLALAERHLEVIGALLDGDPADQGLGGLTVDTDLRWSLVQALAAHGRIDAESLEIPAIDAEVERDPTSAGRRQGAKAAALRPFAAAKADAWEKATVDDDLSHTVARWIIMGFAGPGQGELLTPYVERYFDEVPGIWRRRSSERAQAVVNGLFPTWSVTQDTIDRAGAFLDGDHPAALHRLVSEGRAGLERALAARQADRG